MAQAHDRIWLGRLLVGLVLLLNAQAAAAFLIFPAQYAPGFALSGPVGAGIIRAFGILFVMWTVPYFVAAWHPVRHRTALFEAIAMQAIGLGGETMLLATFPAGYPQVEATILRFIIFDGCGLAALLLAAAVTRGWAVKPQAGSA